MDKKYIALDERITCSESAVRSSLIEQCSSRSSKKSSCASSVTPLSLSVSKTPDISRILSLSSITETDRLISAEGLVTRNSQRSYKLNKRTKHHSYYKGLILSKVRNIRDEITKLQRGISKLEVDREMYFPFKKKAESKAMELKDLEKTLADYNVLCEMLNRGAGIDDVEEEFEDLKAANRKEAAEIEKLFDLTKQLEIVVREMETDITQENDVSEILKTAMTPDLNEKCDDLKRVNRKLQIERMDRDEDLMDLNKKRTDLEFNCMCSKNKFLKKGLKLMRELWAVQDQLVELYSSKEFTTESEEKSFLEKQFSECSELLQGLLQENQNLCDKLKSLKDHQGTIKSVKPTLNSERYQKYLKLKDDEKVFDEFMSSCADNRFALLKRQNELEYRVTDLLKKISNDLEYLNQNTNQENSPNTLPDDASEIAEKKKEYMKVAEEWENFDKVEPMLLEELYHLKNEIITKKNALPVFSDIGFAKEDLKSREEELLNELENVKRQKNHWNFILNDLKERHELLKNKLHNNPTYKTLSKLEKQWHILEEKNHELRSITTDTEDLNQKYLTVKDAVRKLRLELNDML